MSPDFLISSNVFFSKTPCEISDLIDTPPLSTEYNI